MALWRFVKIALWGLLALFLIQFAISNRTPLMVGVWPFPYFVELPAYSLLFIGIFIGLFCAAMVTGWLRLQGFASRRKTERHLRETTKELGESREIAQALSSEKAKSEAVDR